MSALRSGCQGLSRVKWFSFHGYWTQSLKDGIKQGTGGLEGRAEERLPEVLALGVWQPLLPDWFYRVWVCEIGQAM